MATTKPRSKPKGFQKQTHLGITYDRIIETIAPITQFPLNEDVLYNGTKQIKGFGFNKDEELDLVFELLGNRDQYTELSFFFEPSKDITRLSIASAMFLELIKLVAPKWTGATQWIIKAIASNGLSTKEIDNIAIVFNAEASFKLLTIRVVADAVT
jgi:hypothetical protein